MGTLRERVRGLRDLKRQRLQGRSVTMRAKLALASIAVLTMGLVVLIWFSMMGIRHYLGSAVDDKLYAGRDSIERGRVTGNHVSVFTWLAALDDSADRDEARDSIVAQADASGTVLPVLDRPPDAMQRALVAALREAQGLSAGRSTVGVRIGGRDYRAIVARVPSDGSYVVLAQSTDDVEAVVDQVVRLELLVGAGLVLLLGTFIYTAARWRLRPLEDMVETASGIAEGGPDLSRRVAPRKRSFREVEQLRTALNAMLQQVETAFASREHAAAHLKRFAADASHELRTPLAAIRGYLQLYDKGMLSDDERTRALDRMGAEAERMARLVDELLALARLDQRPQLRPRPVDLACVARDAAADLDAQQPDRTVHLDLPDGCLVLADEATLRQIVGNLLVNVRVHTPVSADVHVSVAAVAPNGDGRGLGVLRVRDEGPGMRAEDADRIFDRFFRAALDTAGAGTGAGAGSGLGMAVVHAAVAANDGEVRVETAPGEGLTVTVALPAASHTADTP